MTTSRISERRLAMHNPRIPKYIYPESTSSSRKEGNVNAFTPYRAAAAPISHLDGRCWLEGKYGTVGKAANTKDRVRNHDHHHDHQQHDFSSALRGPFVS